MFHEAHKCPSFVWLKAQTDILRVQSEECRMQSEKRTAETAKGPQIAQIARINAEGGLAEKRQRQGKPREPNDRNKPAACRGMKRRNPQSGWRPAGDGQALKLPLTAEHAENAEGDLGEKRTTATTAGSRGDAENAEGDLGEKRTTVTTAGSRGDAENAEEGLGEKRTTATTAASRKDAERGLGEKRQRQALNFEPSTLNCRRLPLTAVDRLR
jgi:hypothetical protein